MGHQTPILIVKASKLGFSGLRRVWAWNLREGGEQIPAEESWGFAEPALCEHGIDGQLLKSSSRGTRSLQL